MRPPRIQISGVFPALFVLLMSAPFFAPLHSVAQCPAGYAVSTEQHSNTAVGDGSNPTAFTLPQFANPSGYTFLSAQVQVFLTDHLTITFTNTSTTSTVSFKPQIARPDELDLNGTDVFDANGAVSLPTTPLAVAPGPGNTKTYTNQLVYNNTAIVNYTIGTADPSLTDYEGAGNLSFNYIPLQYINFVPTPPVTYSPPTIVDNFTFQVTYSYCEPTVLSSDITTFTATRSGDQAVALNWITTNEQAGRRYHVEVSTDGQHFQDDGVVLSDSLHSDASYAYLYAIAAGASGKLYFRLKQVLAGGTANYSLVRIIDLGVGGPTGFALYPNPPSDYINLSFPATHAWQVDILAADGSLVQRNYFANTNLARVSFNRKLPVGAYFARATDSRDGKSFVAGFAIRQ